MNRAESLPDLSARVTITRGIIGFCSMQVCAVDDVTDDEILAHCNQHNPSGTSAGWTTVVRVPDGGMFQMDATAPVACALHPGRTHFRVNC